MIKPLKITRTLTLSAVLIPQAVSVAGMFIVAGCAATPAAKSDRRWHTVDVGIVLAELDARRRLAVSPQTCAVHCQ